jgi:hypothetical protein
MTAKNATRGATAPRFALQQRFDGHPANEAMAFQLSSL